MENTETYEGQPTIFFNLQQLHAKSWHDSSLKAVLAATKPRDLSEERVADRIVGWRAQTTGSTQDIWYKVQYEPSSVRFGDMSEWANAEEGDMHAIKMVSNITKESDRFVFRWKDEWICAEDLGETTGEESLVTRFFDDFQDRTSTMLLSTGQVAFCTTGDVYNNGEVWILTSESLDIVRLEVFEEQDDIEKTWCSEHF